MASIVPRLLCRRGLSGLSSVSLTQSSAPAASLASTSTSPSKVCFSTSSKMQDEEEMAEDARNPVRVDMRFHNHVTLMGRVTRHPKTVGQGNTEITFFDLITKRFYENESGEVTEDPHYHTIMVTNKTRGIHNYVKNTVKKGDRVYVEGSLRYNIKQLEDGKSRKDPSIVVEDLITVSAAY